MSFTLYHFLLNKQKQKRGLRMKKKIHSWQHPPLASLLLIGCYLQTNRYMKDVCAHSHHTEPRVKGTKSLKQSEVSADDSQDYLYVVTSCTSCHYKYMTETWEKHRSPSTFQKAEVLPSFLTQLLGETRL